MVSSAKGSHGPRNTSLHARREITTLIFIQITRNFCVTTRCMWVGDAFGWFGSWFYVIITPRDAELRRKKEI